MNATEVELVLGIVNLTEQVAKSRCKFISIFFLQLLEYQFLSLLLKIILNKETGCWELLKEVKVGCLEIEILTIESLKR